VPLEVTAIFDNPSVESLAELIDRRLGRPVPGQAV
jgi:hypothetical protein